jgi:hypothetical protein
MNPYVQWVIQNPLLSAAVQFGLLGTLGETISVSLKARRLRLPGTWMQTVAKIAAWALLGVVIKYGFTAMRGFTQALLDHDLLPDALGQGWGWALALSVLTNTFFGPQMMAFHRWEDNLILRRRGYAGISRAWWTLVWFWIPAHTVTFSLPKDYQIGLAALWSVALGIIMGFSRK